MTPEWYERVNRIADAALSRNPVDRAAYLEEACAGDADLRRHVEALLAAEDGDQEFLSTPVFETLARDTAAEWEKRAALPGSRIGRYEILRKLGAGGIGEVWLARDTELLREVALKLLNPAFGSDPDQVDRLKREARAASVLNQPNIVTIYEIGETAGVHFIAQEFIAGSTLRRLLVDAGGKLPAAKALTIAAQIAAALEAAHAAHIVHRDVKPENVMIRPDGLVKLVDFGLAAPRDTEARVKSVMGTVRYMSPEQARGEGVDARTDLFSLGVVLQEMLPGEIEPIVRKCLQKSPEDRYGSATELRADIERARLRLEKRWPLAKKIFVATAALVFAVAIPFAIPSIDRHSTSTFNSMMITRLTTRGQVAGAAISPDGASIVYALDEGDRQSLWLRETASNNERQLVAAEAREHLGLTFSPVGDAVFYTNRSPDGSDILYRLALAPPVKTAVILDDVASPIAFSPDGRHFAFIRLGRFRSETALMTANIDGSGLRTVATRIGPRYYSRSGLAWSPDGRSIMCLAGQEKYYTGNAFHLVAVRVADGAETDVGKRAWPWVGALIWSRGNVLLVAGENSESSEQIWRIGYPNGDVHRVTNDLTNYAALSISGDGEIMASVQKETTSELWTMRAGQSAAQASRISQGDLRDLDSLALLPDGRVVYTARSGEYRNLWMVDADGANPRQLTEGSTKREIAATRDGRYILYQSAGKIWRVNADGSGAVQLTFGALDVHPWPTADGSAVIYCSFQDWSPVIGGRPQLWRVPIDGGNASRISDAAMSLPHISPDGKTIEAVYFPAADPRFSSEVVAVMPIDGGPPKVIGDLLPGASDHYYWSPDGRSLISTATIATVSNLWRVPLDRKPEPITDFKSGLIVDFTVGADGRLVLARGKSSSDVVLIRNCGAGRQAC